MSLLGQIDNSDQKYSHHGTYGIHDLLIIQRKVRSIHQVSLIGSIQQDVDSLKLRIVADELLVG